MKPARIVMLGALGTLAGMGLALGAWWQLAAPPAYFQAAPAHRFGALPAGLDTAADASLGATLARSALAIPGHDDVLLQEHLGRAFVTSRDQWIWIVDLASGQAERFVKMPMSPHGARWLPGDEDTLLVCNARLDDESYAPGVESGVYALTISTRAIRPLAVRVPLPPAARPPQSGNQGEIFTESAMPAVATASLDAGNSRPVRFCNDLDVSADGKRIYISEPFDYEHAAAGTGAIPEAIALGANGRIWQFDLARQTTRLVAQGYTFADGILLERGDSGVEESLLITETTKSRILRLTFAGARAGQDEVLWENLPGLPDGLERDAAGRVWVALIKSRSKLASWAHAHPWVKPFFQRLPHSLLPVPRQTGVIVLSPDLHRVEFFNMHDGSAIRDIAAVTPGRERVYFSSFAHDNAGLASMPYPPVLRMPAQQQEASRP